VICRHTQSRKTQTFSSNELDDEDGDDNEGVELSGQNWPKCSLAFTQFSIRLCHHPSLNPSSLTITNNHPSSQLASFQIFFVAHFIQFWVKYHQKKLRADLWMVIYLSFQEVLNAGTHCRHGCIWPAIYYPMWGPGPILILGQIHKFLRKFRKSQSLEHRKYLKKGENKLFLLFSFSKSFQPSLDQDKAGDTEKDRNGCNMNN